jgi:putative addiction module killer protein
MFELEIYQAENGKEPYTVWLQTLDTRTRLKVVASVERLADGNISNLKGLGGGVSELKINFGAGYRVYLARKGDALIILISGGSKKRQQKDIDQAKAIWREILDNDKTERKG